MERPGNGKDEPSYDTSGARIFPSIVVPFRFGPWRCRHAFANLAGKLDGHDDHHDARNACQRVQIDSFLAFAGQFFGSALRRRASAVGSATFGDIRQEQQ
jgi:hypothetical protein